MPTVYRIVKTKYAKTAFDGEGAFRYGGRWNTRGTRLIYTAGSLSLAALEMLVHLDDDELLWSYSFVAAQIPPHLILPVRAFRSLPKHWNASPSPVALQQIGDAWVRANASAVLEVPTSIVPLESNYLINPAHPDYPQITLEKPRRFVFDERLRKG
ncbi:MAG TPA: RES domain-containing protein [Blastocatellia bacterium]|nr:RES domain-containing protein [Blastocatellia bacterium]